MSSFSQLNLPEPIINALNQVQITIPTEIQRDSIPLGLQHNNLIVQAPSGSGKTITFLSILLTQYLQQNHQQINPHAIFSLILSPTRELAQQIFIILNMIIQNMNIQVKTGICIGGLPIDQDIILLEKGVSILVGTLGRLSGIYSLKKEKFQGIQILILDEADSYIQKKEYCAFIKKLQWSGIKNYAFSATYTEKSLFILRGIYKDSYIYRTQNKKVKLDEEENISSMLQYGIQVNRGYEERLQMLRKILVILQFNQTIIFFNDKMKGEELANELMLEDIYPAFIHGNMNQVDRMRVINKLILEKTKIIISTDLVSILNQLSRGLDIQNIDLIINFDLPLDKETYIHRIGRTARNKKFGLALTLFNEKTSYLQDIQLFDLEDQKLIQNINTQLQKQQKELKKSETTQYYYGNESQIQEWCEVNNSIGNLRKNSQLTNSVLSYEEDLSQELQIQSHLHDNDNYDWDFLKCSFCYNFLLKSEKMMGKKFQILKFFQIND